MPCSREVVLGPWSWGHAPSLDEVTVRFSFFFLACTLHRTPHTSTVRDGTTTTTPRTTFQRGLAPLAPRHSPFRPSANDTFPLRPRPRGTQGCVHVRITNKASNKLTMNKDRARFMHLPLEGTHSHVVRRRRSPSLPASPRTGQISHPPPSPVPPGPQTR